MKYAPPFAMSPAASAEPDVSVANNAATARACIAFLWSFMDIPSSVEVARLALVANVEHANQVMDRVEMVGREISGLAAGNDEFPKLAVQPAAEEWMRTENLQRLEDWLDDLIFPDRTLFFEKVHESSQIPQRTRRENYFRHAIGLGRFTFLPATRARM